MEWFERRRRSVAIVVAWLVLLGLAAPGAAGAAQSVTRVRITGDECAALVAATGEPEKKACVVVVESGGATDGELVAAAACYVPSGYTHCGTTWVRSQSVLLVWSVTATATYYRNATTGKVLWTSVTCTQSAIGYTIKISWCGSWHNGLPDTNYGANFDVSFVWEGSPITVSHGMRASINGRTGAGCCLQSW
ncbi:MAG TPA: hypothetical protein VFX65_01750 [Candidatus Limnocylindrales bacterium]|nr:hypothetical protein [Candidatus Limnocylindrales bacterium]